MDFVKKKAFEAKLNKVGKDLGFGSNISSGLTGSASGHERQSQWSVLPSMRGNTADEEAPPPVSEESPFPSQAAIVFDSKPRNFPPLLRLFYVDRSILTPAAMKVVNNAFYVLSTVCVLLVLNVVANVVHTAVQKGKQWVHLLIGALLALLVCGAELVAYETAFRGAYRNSGGLRQHYMLFCAGNIVLFGAYAFVGASFFNGWAKMTRFSAENEKNESYRFWGRLLTAVEAFMWTGLSMLNIYTLFDYYHLYKGQETGLAQEALDAALSAAARGGGRDGVIAAEDTVGQDGRPAPRGARAERARIQEIRDRYRTTDTNDG